MTINMIQFGDKPGYASIVATIVDGIARRILVAGERLPPQRELAHQLGVAIATVGRAYTQLEKQGFVESHVGRGTFIAGGRGPSSDISDNISAETIDLSVYRVPVPDLDSILADTMKAIIAEHHPQQILGSSPAAGQPGHRQSMVSWLQRSGVLASAAQVIITNGGQHATMAALSTLTHAGETIATEEFTDPKMKSVASYLDRKLVGVDMDEEGMIPESLDLLCRNQTIAAIYVTTRAQNPTNATLPLARREAIAEIGRRYDLPIVESDIYGTTMTDPLPPIYALAPERTHFITSLGRIAGPGIKVGCLVSPLNEVAKTQSGVGMSTGSATLLAAEIIARWIDGSHLDGMIRWQQAENIRRLSLLATYPLLGTARTDIASPHVWLPLPEQWRAEEFIDAAAADGITIAPTHSFVVGRRPMPHAVRLCIGSPASVETLKVACGRLERLLNSQPKSNFET
ncbi:aminotransferase class I/II-fold pyridoxal phosphate-dependent enzyme [Rhizobium lusitanum]|uniref:Aminotransferase class I/II-fold pyridoxal phosphate-dependent enzyme n=1 Tax=Rhizobium lusitanum TaxID=293958 RepID=A0A6L9UE68_9HYPH|nr:PLP-dependent aminotransferase family protein [Rhizobium lusitanum]NEI73651.1 aminotransferase class I/II-fold pyridoxal phosphate-dependent enzyme [Rhizobium lusitanum]